MPRTRLLLIALVALALAGLAAGLVVARGSGASGRVHAGVVASGPFQSISWTTRGRAAIVGKKDGTAVLRLTAFQTQQAPELWIVLEGRQGVTSRRQLTNLRSAWGNQEYAVPADVAVHPPARVLIYCAKCGKVWGYAQLRRSF
ncbi:MAG: DM13 domain-containing protein [Actinobacteria bacterium]|nr:DM13 domain-containing protein [Actinomycetota bacterium]